MSFFNILTRKRSTKRKYFTKQEALAKIERRVYTIRDLNGIPKKAKGKVVRAIQYHWDEWVILIEWQFSENNMTVRSFAKSEYNRYIKEVSD